MARLDKDPTWWRRVSSPADFCAKAGLGPNTTERVLRSMGTLDTPTSDNNLLGFAAFDLRLLFSQVDKPQNLQALLASDSDELIGLWCALRAEYDDVQPSVYLQRQALDHAVSRMSGLGPRLDVWRDTTRNAAFLRAEKADARGHGQYAESNYLAPHSTIVGPSGIGKTFAVRQMAVRYGIYVAYSNLARPDSLGFPRPVTMGRTPVDGVCEKPVALWAVYLDNQVRLALGCRAVGITAAGLFELLTSGQDQVVLLRGALQSRFHSDPVDADAMRTLLAPLKDTLDGLGLNAPPLEPTPPPANGALPVVVCFDEARALLDRQTDLAFRTLRQAAARTADTGDKKTVPPFFVVLLDTTSRISNFTFTSPSQHDPSAKALRRELHHPIYRIDTFDLFTPPAASLEDPTGSDVAMGQLFAHGRPLWGAELEAGSSWSKVLKLAQEKISHQTEPLAYDLSLLAYRINFSISSPVLAEAMVAASLRYLVSVSPDRNSLISTQPSEPVLAVAAACRLQDPSVRQRCLRSWIRSLHAGAVHPGDLGEQVAALVLLFASDYATEPSKALPAQDPTSGIAPTPVPLRAISTGDFFRALLGPDVWQLVLSRRHGPSIQAMLESGSIFFHHMIRLTTTPTRTMLEAAYKRGAALFLPGPFPGMDMAIPVRVPTGRMALLLVQVKNRPEDSLTPGLRLYMQEALEKAEKALGLSDALDGLCGIAGLVMCLRTSGPARFDAADAAGSHAMGQRTRSRPKRASVEEKATLLGMAFGLDPSLYPCMMATSAAAAQTVGGALDGSAKRKAMCVLLAQLLEQWPHAYANEDVQTPYAQKLLNPVSELGGAL